MFQSLIHDYTLWRCKIGRISRTCGQNAATLHAGLLLQQCSKRFMDLKDFLPNLEMDEIDDLMLTTSEVRKIEALCTRFEHMDSVTKALQSDNVKIVKVSPILIGLTLTIFYTIIL